jgi:hypothetical protein
LAELIQRGGSGDLSEGLDVTGSVDELPKTAHLVIFLMGRASEKFDAALREEYADAGRALLDEAAST